MTTHSSILAWEISWTEGLDGLLSVGSQKSRTRLKQPNSNSKLYVTLERRETFCPLTQQLSASVSLNLGTASDSIGLDLETRHQDFRKLRSTVVK